MINKLVKKMDFILFKKRVQYLDLVFRHLLYVVFKVNSSKNIRINYQLLYSKRKANFTYFPVKCNDNIKIEDVS